MREFRRLLGYLEPRHRIEAAVGALIVAVETSLELLIPVLMAGIIDTGIPQGDISLIVRQGLLMAALALLSLVLGLSYARFSSRAAVGLGASLRRAEYDAVQRLAFQNLDRFRTSSLVTRMTTDITVIQNAFSNGFRPMVRGPVILAMGLIYASSMNLELAGVFFALLPILAGALALITCRVAPLYRRLQASMDELNGVLREDFTAIRAVKAHVREDHQRAVFDGVNDRLAVTSTRTLR